MRTIIFILLSFNCLSQNNVKGLYLGFSPNATFSKVTQNDFLNGLNTAPGIGAGVNFGYIYPINSKISIASELNFIFNTYKSSYLPVDFRTSNSRLLPILKFNVKYTASINSKTKLVSTLGIGVDLLAQYDIQKYDLTDSINFLSVTQKIKPQNNLYVNIGLGFFKIRQKRDFYFGFSFNKGIFKNFYQTNTYFENNTVYFSKIEGSNTHIAIDFVLYLKKKTTSEY